MHRVVDISLSGHPEPFRLHDDAYEALGRYLERARAGLTDDPDRDEVIGDLERSVGEKLATQLSPDKRVFDLADVRSVLDEVGAVDADAVDTPPTTERRHVRRLHRIREGQKIAGVCEGLATYADLDVYMVRWIFAILAIVTAGVFILVYVAAMFILPVVSSRAEYFATMEAQKLAEGLGPHR